MFVDDVLLTLETFIGIFEMRGLNETKANHSAGDMEGFDDPEFEDPLSRGMLVASHPDTAPSVWHRGRISIM